MILKKLVRFHNKDGNRVDRAKFPQVRDGYYEFQGFDDFTNRLQCPLGRTPATNLLHQYTFGQRQSSLSTGDNYYLPVVQG